MNDSNSQPWKKWIVLPAAVLMMTMLGTMHAWSVFIGPLQHAYGYSSVQTGLVFGTEIFFFCVTTVLGGRLQDRLGPRRVAAAGGILFGSAYGLASVLGGNFITLWLTMGVMLGAGVATAYVCPLATVVKWFPRHKGLVCGLAAGGFGVGPILLSNLAEYLLHRNWFVLDIFRFVAAIYPPVILLTALLLMSPAGGDGGVWTSFRLRTLLKDRRFWPLFLGMLIGTLPFLVVNSRVKVMGEAWGIPAAAAAISAMAIGNAAGRITWGLLIDRIGDRRAVLASQAVLLASVMALMLAGHIPAVFFLTVAGIGFCFGSNFAIYPATVVHIYGPGIFGSVYSMVMVGQGVSTASVPLAGWLLDRTGSYTPGLVIAAAAVLCGSVGIEWLNRSVARTTVAHGNTMHQ